VFPTGATPDTSSAEFTRNWGVGGVKAEAAWTRGFTGKNVIIGVVDDGLIPSDPEIAGRVHPGSKDIVDSRNQLTGPGTHGTELAVFIAGAFNDVATVGVAYEATILGIRADDPGCFTTSCGFLNADLARGLDYAVSQGAKVVNFSLGSSNPSSQAFRDALARATAAGTIIVVSAGNDGPLAPDVNFPGRYANDPTISSGLILTVGAINPAGALANFSNVAGPSQNWYLVAPGDQVFTIDSGAVGATDPAFQTCFPDFTCRMQGTSYSAPHVAGGIALLLQAFPGLTPQQIVQLALQSAEDVGAPGVDSTFGRGRFNIERAFAPIGPLSAPLAAAVEGNTSSAFQVKMGSATYVGTLRRLPLAASQPIALAVLGDRTEAMALASVSGVILALMGIGVLLVLAYGFVVGTSFLRPLEAIEEGVLTIINGRTDVRIDVESPEFGGLAYRINQLVNMFTGTEETDEEGHTVNVSGNFAAVDDGGGGAPASGAGSEGEGDDAELAARLAAEPEADYHARVYREYVAAKKAAGEDVSNIPEDRFIQRLQKNAEGLVAKNKCRMVRFEVVTKGDQVTLRPVIIR